MAEFVRFMLDDGSEVLFESAESDLVALHGGGQPDVRDGGKLTARLQGVAEAAEEVAGSLPAEPAPRTDSHCRRWPTSTLAPTAADHKLVAGSRARSHAPGPFGLMGLSSGGCSAGPSVDSGTMRAGRQEPPQFGGGRGDRRGMGQRVAQETGQQ
jgi:hypothetical protein